MEIKEALILDENDPLSKALAGILDSRTAVIITRDGKYCGIIDDRNMWLLSVENPVKTKCKTMAIKPTVLNPETGILERIDAFLGGHFKALPIVDERGKPLGITTRVELLRDMSASSLIPKAGVKTLMSSPVYLIDEKKTVAEAKLEMKKYDARRLVVTSRGIPRGTFSTLDLAAESLRPLEKQKMAFVATKRSYDDQPLVNIYRPDVTTVPENSSVEEAAAAMIRKSVSSVVVMGGNKPAGVLSAIDIFKNVREAAKESLEIDISGLDDETIIYRDSIRQAIEKVADKFAVSFGVRRVGVHVKAGKSVYTVNILLEGDKENFSIRAEGPKISDTVNIAAAELGERLSRKKGLLKSRKSLTKGGFL
ncbi:CBS domain-containing protein [Candidatus Micrarchaeota archaeon]|nr:CBS domain-containing protein [Candidatus Micrarchaeota archaeon]